jgi:hypothetical protein
MQLDCICCEYDRGFEEVYCQTNPDNQEDTSDHHLDRLGFRLTSDWNSPGNNHGKSADGEKEKCKCSPLPFQTINAVCGCWILQLHGEVALQQLSCG